MPDQPETDQPVPDESVPDERAPARRIRTYLGWSFAATLLCFLPLGLVALYFGFRVTQLVARGADDEAARASRIARRWLIAAVLVGVGIYALIVVVFALLGAFSQ